MHYLAILGRQPEFGLLELEALTGAEQVHPFGAQAALLQQELDLNRLGGTQKIGRVLYRGPARDLNEAPFDLEALPLRAGKTSFGLSYYGVKASAKFVLAAGLTLKKRLKPRGSIRLVTPQTGTTLSAAQVKFNNLIRQGFELLVVVHRDEMVVALTEQIQDIDWYAVRDYQRPTRSAQVGMLPPKLAQIMVNTTTAPLVYDPFCGTGVILQETLLLGRAAAGSDLSPEMVAATQDNLVWLGTKRSGLATWQVSLADSRQAALPDEPLAIVSEGYLGPNHSRRPTVGQIQATRRELLELYRSSLGHWANQVETGTELTITTPVWNTATGWQPLGLVDRLTDLGYTLRSFTHVDSHSLVYRRPNQFVGRQLILARKS